MKREPNLQNVCSHLSIGQAANVPMDMHIIMNRRRSFVIILIHDLDEANEPQLWFDCFSVFLGPILEFTLTADAA